MKRTITLLFLTLFSTTAFSEYKIITNKGNIIDIPKTPHIEQEEENWQLFYSQRNFNFTDGIIDLSTFPDSQKFKIQHSPDFYIVFDGNIKTSTLKTNGGRKVWAVNNSLEIINNENLPVGSYFTIIENTTNSAISPLIFGNSQSEPWCSPVNGKYNGVCYDGFIGKGDWDIYLLPLN